ncbi:hypothetical protein A3740_17005 [Oleiphilus sp. HI0068]|uniref:hypothetical protein n=1 Tax=Oleiphilus sp. HI0132 TaxID=1822270 RepID=UPI0007C25A5A|nr:hypothetical protein [Oleiphilus sp. HI0132]KZY74270.1 hypothetical protein A3740_17005 [Oleiphilus sp. HI0068]KZY83189.1 hypothetical protein A3741_16745 [Oleiphilus sp. HI0069]KZZ33457.1 hypothetical protein A3755_07725 [Oleiphilus sp. HI0085]KZZ75890.1 hypothetical protein A3766_15505 [Oleiphilus sp. HI0132]
MEQCWPPTKEEEIESLDEFAYVYRCDHCNKEITVSPTVSAIIAQEIAISENADWIFYENETFCSKSCESNFGIKAR